MNKYPIFVLIISCCFATSCTYYPRLTSVPLIKEKGDTRIEGGVGILSPSLQASISQGVTDKIAYQVSASIDPNESIGLYAQGAVGYYKNISDQNVLELYGGFAYGRSNAYINANPGNLFGNFQVYFLQFNYGNIKKKKANFESGFGIKSGLIHSNMRDANYFSVSFDNTAGKPYPVYHINGILVEPTAFLRFGGEKLKFWTAVGYSLHFQLNHTDKQLPANAPGFGVGISYSFGGKSKQK